MTHVTDNLSMLDHFGSTDRPAVFHVANHSCTITCRCSFFRLLKKYLQSREQAVLTQVIVFVELDVYLLEDLDVLECTLLPTEILLHAALYKLGPAVFVVPDADQNKQAIMIHISAHVQCTDRHDWAEKRAQAVKRA